MTEKEFTSWFKRRVKALRETKADNKKRISLEDTLYTLHVYFNEHKAELKPYAIEDYKDKAFEAAGITFSLQEINALEKLWKLQEG
jgi:hypothetical protein